MQTFITLTPKDPTRLLNAGTVRMVEVRFVDFTTRTCMDRQSAISAIVAKGGKSSVLSVIEHCYPKRGIQMVRLHLEVQEQQDQRLAWALNATSNITCACGTRILPEGWLDRLVVWINPPIAGERIEFAGGWLKELPAALIEKIQQATDTADFTPDELHAIALVRGKIEAVINPRPEKRACINASKIPVIGEGRTS